MKTMGDMVKAARLRAGYKTQKMLGDRIGRDSSYISDLERGAVVNTLPPHEMHKLHDVLGIRVNDLLAASGYHLEGEVFTEGGDVAEITEHARMVDWEADPSRLQVISAIMETWSRFDRNSLRLVAEQPATYDDQEE